ncbi:MAG TPA: decarboxylating 6-phosphogluconate dehydrogenase [Anaerolineales bacterium]|jgi:6-phosphogluconate dehydrogenase|nr:decarboxylating 6-phosphogluconate dehydrogenase [Anaerolineales bacterium]
MEIGMIGLGKMGANMVNRLLLGGHRVVAYDINEDPIQAVEKAGAIGARTLNEVVQNLAPPRSVWVMVPSGQITEDTIQTISDLLSPGDVVIDGGNSNYKDSIRRADELANKGLYFIDVGTSGGVWGLKEGYSMMVGGDQGTVERHSPIFETLAPSQDLGWGHVGSPGSGHFVKMVHNGIEYGLMQAYAEGFSIMKAKTDFALDLHQIAEIWRYGSVVRSWLLDLTANALAEDQDLDDIKAWVQDSGEGRWTVFEAIDLDISAPVITASLQRRLRSREDQPFSDKLLAAMRNQFGGHAVKKVE